MHPDSHQMGWQDRGASMPNPLTPPGHDAELWERVSSAEDRTSDDWGKRPQSSDEARHIMETPGRTNPQKDLQQRPSQEPEGRAAELAEHMELTRKSEALEGHNEVLQQHVRALEQLLGLQVPAGAEKGPVQHAQVWWLDQVTRQMVEQRLHLGGLLTFTLRGGLPFTLSRDQVAALTWSELCALWKDYIEAVSMALVEAAGTPDSVGGKRLERLVFETGVLMGCMATDSPGWARQLHCLLPEGEPRPQAPRQDQWLTIAHSLALEPAQQTQVVQLRRMYLGVLANSVSQRRQLLQKLHASLTTQQGCPPSEVQYMSTAEDVEHLKTILRDEHSLLAQYRTCIWSCVLTPSQAALCILGAYPYSADLVSIASHIAQGCGEPSSADMMRELEGS